MSDLRISPLAHLWMIDVDGTVLRHNGHKNGTDALLPGVAAFWKNIPAGDCIILLSARAETEREATLAVFTAHDLRFDQALFGLPTGERILINDRKPGGMATSVAVNVMRDAGLENMKVVIDRSL